LLCWAVSPHPKTPQENKRAFGTAYLDCYAAGLTGLHSRAALVVEPLVFVFHSEKARNA
jgi:hypothetical protein